MEYIDAGNLEDFISERQIPLQETEIWTYFIDLLLGFVSFPLRIIIEFVSV